MRVDKRDVNECSSDANDGRCRFLTWNYFRLVSFTRPGGLARPDCRWQWRDCGLGCEVSANGLIKDQLHVKPICRKHTEQREEGLPNGAAITPS
jgi:hypothetical protein